MYMWLQLYILVKSNVCFTLSSSRNAVDMDLCGILMKQFRPIFALLKSNDINILLSSVDWV